MSKPAHSLYPWLVITISSFLLFYKYLLQVFPSVITHTLMLDFGLDGLELGNLAACFFYSYVIVQLFAGYLLDRYPIKWMITAMTLISAIGAVWFSLAESYETTQFARILMGIGAAFATVGYLKLATVFFEPERFGLISGLLPTAVMLGAVFGQAPMNYTIEHIGWRHAVMIMGLIGLAICMALAAGIHLKKARHVCPQQEKPVTFHAIRDTLKVPANWYLTLYSGLAFAPTAVFSGLWGIPFLTAAYPQESSTAVSALVSLSYVGLGVGGPLFGLLANHASRYKMMYLGLAISFAGLVFSIYCRPPHAILALCLFAIGFGTSAFMLGFTEGKDRNPLYLAATVIATINTGDALFGAISQPLVGQVLDWLRRHHHHSASAFSAKDFQVAFLLLLAFILLAGLCLYASRPATKSTKA
jgi:MFS family permease